VLLRAAAAISAVPVAAFVVLAATGALAAAPAAIAATLTVAASLGLAAFLERDVSRLRATLGQAARIEGPVRAELPRLPALASVAPEIRRLTGALAERAAMVERLRDADRAILDRLPDPLILLGPDRTVRRANAAARAAFGDDIAAVLRHPTLRRAIDRALAGRDSQQVDLALNVPVARQLHATVFVLDVPLADGTATIAVLSDRSRERAVERMRADFVANASHELRTPLASLIGFIETLRGPAADDRPAQQRFLAIMAEQAERMNRIIDDLLGLSRIELTEHRPPSESVDLAALVPRIVAGFEPRVTARGVTLAVEVADGLPPVVADADQLAQVLHNLLDNAVKYGREAGTIRLSVRPVASDPRFPARPGVLIAVADDGTGIPREHLPRLTERFYRVDAGRSRAVGGTGLGLAIVKHIVNRHRGQLAIESEEGAGTTVSVWLPQAKADGAA
jgi:two-component system phosphate regulon sensor histidine kinase PhoR